VSAISRWVWDGEQLLGETRAPGGDGLSTAQLDQLTGSAPSYGTVGYVHLQGIDQPSSLVSGRVLHANWRGVPESSVLTNGTDPDCSWGTAAPPTCLTVRWATDPGVYFRRPIPGPPPVVVPTWLGSLAGNGQTGSGRLYRRSREYDPATGQFTHEDPLGLAGGLSPYGFANGDPVNFSDPFGLMACPPYCDVFQQLAAWAPAMKGAMAVFAAGSVAGGAALAAAGGGGGAATVTLGLRGMSSAGAASAVAAAVRAAGGTAGQQIFDAGRRIGEMGLSQGAAVRAVEQSIAQLGFEMGPTVSIGGSRFVLAARASSRGIDAIGVDAAGRTTRALVRIGEKGWEVVENLGAIRQR
jgi:RHS repeat-associated protein